MNCSWLRPCLGCVAALTWFFLPVHAQSLRDPTLPPAAAAASNSAPGELGRAHLLGPGNMAVLVRDGVSYLVLGTRLYTKGQRVGQARIERITETEVWLREDGQLRKVTVFSGIERHEHAPPVAPASDAALVRKLVRKKH